MDYLKKYKSILLVALIFCVIYSLISFANHYFFKTYALDLGAYTNALYDYSHFQFNDSTVFKIESENLLADHFDLYLIILSPLSFLFGTYTLLIVQILSVLFGGFGIYNYFKHSETYSHLAIPASLYFYLFFGVYSALAFDYHSNVLAAMMVPWFFFYIQKRKLITASLFLIVIIIAKENVSLWMAFVCLGLLFQYRSDILLRKYFILGSIFCAFYFVLITSYVMPALSNGHSYAHFDYSALGTNFKEAIIHLVTHPIESIKTLFINHTNEPLGDYVKIELHVLLVIAGLLILLRKPYYLLMLIPIYFQKLFHDNHNMWGVADQYSIEFAPILAIGIFSVIGEIKNKKVLNWSINIVLILCFATTIRIMDNPIAYIDKTRIRIYKQAHYAKEYDVKKVYQALSIIPDKAIVSAQSAFLPHLALRDKVYQFPIIKDASYIIFSELEGSYPLSEEAMDAVIIELNNTHEWESIYNFEKFQILKRKSSILEE